MNRRQMARRPGTAAVDTQALMETSGVVKSHRQYARGASIFRQGDVADDVLYIESGAVKLSVLSRSGKEAIVAMLGAGDFFGEGCMAGQRIRMGGATALGATSITVITKPAMVRALHKHHAMSDRFIAHMLTRNIRIEEDLIDQLFNSSEKRLARTLLLLARYGKQQTPARTVPKISQETLAKMVGTTRARVNFFLNKFKKLGFIEYEGGLPVKINQSLLSVVLHE
jgi:CRP/FNR family cyclic AMP-dependent transcriptional regulator